MKISYLGVLLALSATTLWAGNFVLARVAPASMDPVSLTFLRWLLATIIVLPFVVRPMWQHRRELVANARMIAVTAVLGIVIFNVAVYSAGSYLDATRMSLVNALSPVLILFLAALWLGERINVRNLLGSAIAVIGVGLSAVDPGAASPGSLLIGLGLMVVAAFSFATYTVLFRRLQRFLSFTVLVGATFTLGTLLLLPPFLLNGAVSGFPTPNVQNLWIIFYAGVFAALAAFLAWNLAVTMIGASRAGYIYYLVPLISALQAAILIAEPPNWSTMLATPVVLAGVYIASRSHVPSSTRPTPQGNKSANLTGSRQGSQP